MILKPGLRRAANNRIRPVWDFRRPAFTDRWTSLITLTRASSKTYFDGAGTLRTAATNEPCIDYDPVTLVCKGLSIHEARTNVFLNSLADGTSLSTQSITVTAAPWTISFYGTGTITFSGAYTGSLVGTGDTARAISTFTPSAGTLTCTVSGTVKWANAELGASATPFIATAGATATRAADVASMTGANFSSWYNQSEGTFVFVGDVNATTADTGNRVLHGVAQNGVFNESMYVVRAVGSAGLTMSIIDGGVAQWGGTPGNVSANTQFVHAFGYKLNDGAQSLNGGAVQTDSAMTLPTVDTYALGTSPWSPGSGGNTINGHIARIAYYPSRLPDTVLQGLSV